jgi:ferredoxin
MFLLNITYRGWIQKKHKPYSYYLKTTVEISKQTLETQPNKYLHIKKWKTSTKKLNTSSSNNRKQQKKKKKKKRKETEPYRARLKLKEPSSVSHPLALLHLFHLASTALSIRTTTIPSFLRSKEKKKLRNKTENQMIEYQFSCRGQFGFCHTCQRPVLLDSATHTPLCRGGKRSWWEQFRQSRGTNGISTWSWEW